jgi:hypothetical protein
MKPSKESLELLDLRTRIYNSVHTEYMNTPKHLPEFAGIKLKLEVWRKSYISAYKAAFPNHIVM